MRRFLRPLIASAAMAVIAGCSDSTMGPRDVSTRAITPSFSRSSHSSSGSNGSSATQTATVTLTAAGGTFNIGGYTLTVPANAVCEPASGYGEGMWDQPCTTLSGDESISMNAVYGNNANGPYVIFSGQVRFSPSAAVTLSTMTYASLLTAFKTMWLANPAGLGFLGIYVINPQTGGLTADAAVDAALVTYANVTTGQVWRRLKHLSGYNVATGATGCDPADPTCVSVAPVVVQ